MKLYYGIGASCPPGPNYLPDCVKDIVVSERIHKNAGWDTRIFTGEIVNPQAVIDTAAALFRPGVTHYDEVRIDNSSHGGVSEKEYFLYWGGNAYIMWFDAFVNFVILRASECSDKVSVIIDACHAGHALKQKEIKRLTKAGLHPEVAAAMAPVKVADSPINDGKLPLYWWGGAKAITEAKALPSNVFMIAACPANKVALGAILGWTEGGIWPASTCGTSVLHSALGRHYHWWGNPGNIHDYWDDHYSTPIKVVNWLQGAVAGMKHGLAPVGYRTGGWLWESWGLPIGKWGKDYEGVFDL